MPHLLRANARVGIAREDSDAEERVLDRSSLSFLRLPAIRRGHSLRVRRTSKMESQGILTASALQERKETALCQHTLALPLLHAWPIRACALREGSTCLRRPLRGAFFCKQANASGGPAGGFPLHSQPHVPLIHAQRPRYSAFLHTLGAHLICTAPNTMLWYSTTP